MTIRLTLLCVRPTHTTFGPAPLSERDLDGAGASLASLPAHTATLMSPSVASALVATALGLRAAVEPELRDIDYGAWRGRTVAEIVAADPYGYSRWLTDPDAAPHGGETTRRLCERIGDWLSELPPDTARTLAIVEAPVLQAVLVHALAAPLRAFWKLPVPPLRTVHLTCRDGVWNIRTAYVSSVQDLRQSPSVPLTTLTAPGVVSHHGIHV
ncbi:histidine phosphatase family protein [Streptomyces sp. NPDC101166]|uniref:histidine phosphatase family protein n=1 Tax=Streptomyces sp. NPDC101166 TaxID=3366120 RepID=UPI00380959E2